jgi:hypothetical protein
MAVPHVKPCGTAELLSPPPNRKCTFVLGKLNFWVDPFIRLSERNRLALPAPPVTAWVQRGWEYAVSMMSASLESKQRLRV